MFVDNGYSSNELKNVYASHLLALNMQGSQLRDKVERQSTQPAVLTH